MPRIPAPIDFTAIPREYERKWVLVRVADGQQEVIASADDPTDLPGGGLYTGDPDLILTKVPPEQTVVVVRLDEH